MKLPSNYKFHRTELRSKIILIVQIFGKKVVEFLNWLGKKKKFWPDQGDFFKKIMIASSI